MTPRTTLLLLLLASFSLICPVTGCPRYDAAKTEADVVSTVIRHTLLANDIAELSSANVVFLAVPGDTESLKPTQWYRDPPKQWLDRLPEISAKLQPFSRANVTLPDGAISSETGSQSAAMLLIYHVRILDGKSASVDVEFLQNVGGGYGFTYDLVREHGIWRVAGRHGV